MFHPRVIFLINKESAYLDWDNSLELGTAGYSSSTYTAKYKNIQKTNDFANAIFDFRLNITFESVKSINYGNHSLKKDYHPIAHLGSWDCEKWDVEKQAETNKIMEWNGMI